VHAICAEAPGEVRTVIQDEGNASVLRDAEKGSARLQDLVIADILQPQLQAGDIAAAKRLAKRVTEAPVELGRRDEVKSAAN
jgi:hypothetical protein